MHLTDSNLLELKEITPSEKLHLDNCQSCQQRLAEITKARSQFSTLPEEEAADIWQSLDAHIDQVASKKIESIDSRRKKQVFVWKTVSGSLAASFALFATLTFFVGSKANKDQLKLIAQLIERSNNLQQVVFTAGRGPSIDFIRLEAELEKLDEKINQAYLLGEPSEVKLMLWEQRFELLKQANSMQVSPSEPAPAVIAI